MRSLVVMTALVVAVSPAVGQDADPAATVRRAVDAAGGAEALTRLPAARVRAVGTLFADGATIPVEAEQAYHLPGRSRAVVRLEAKGQKLEVVHVVNGDKTKYTINGSPVPVTEAAGKELRAAALASEVAHLVPLLTDKKFTLRPDKPAKVDPTTVGVVAAVKGGGEFRLGFDRATGHLVRVSRKAFDPRTGKDVEQDQVLSGHKAFDGLVRPTKTVVYQDGVKTLELEAAAFAPLAAVDPKEFATE